MDNKTYNTSQVSGMTGIPIRTIQAYVKDFRECFSELARQRAKGRRFTDQDVQNLFTIKRARTHRMDDEEIKDILSGKKSMPLASKYNDQEIKDMAVNAAESLDRALAIQRRLTESIEPLKISNGNAWRKINQLESTVNKLHEWQTFMMKKYPDEFNPWLEEQRKALQKLEAEQAREEKKVTQEKRQGWLHGILHPEEKYLTAPQARQADEVDNTD